MHEFQTVTTLCLKKKRPNFETVWLKIIMINFDDIWQKYSKYSRIEFARFSFHVGLLVAMLSSLKLHTENNACFFWKSWVALKRAGFSAEDAQSGIPWPSHTLGVALATGQLRRR